MRRAALLAIPVALFLCVPVAAAEQPTPADWEQWQAQTDTSDTRLHTTFVSVWEERITVEQLLSRLSGQSSVELSAIEYLRPIRVTVFAEGCTLGGMMSSLAHLFEGYWVFRRGEGPEQRAYVLAEHEAETLGFYEWVEQYVRKDRQAFAAAHRRELEERLALYREALRLTPEEVLARYEESDPWLCAEVLEPRARPMIEMICSLDERHLERLVETNRTGMRVRALEPAVQSYFEEWWKNGMPSAWGGGGMPSPDPGADYLPRFATEEERWENATVAISWYGDSVDVALFVPDGMEYQARPMTVETGTNYNPRTARERLVGLGYREATPEYLERAEKEGRAWQEAEARRQAGPSEEKMRYASVLPAPNRTDPRLAIEVDLSSLEGTRLATGDVLEQAARQCGLAVVANYLPPEQCWLPGGLVAPPEEGDGGTPTLGALLDGIRGRRGGGWTWNFHGRYLVARDGEYRLLEASVLPPGLVEELTERLGPGSSISFDELAGLLGALNDAQMVELCHRFPSLDYVSACGAGFYGQLTSDQRATLGEPGGLSFAELPGDWRYMYLERARWSRPWLGPEDVANARVRSIPRTLSSGGEGISVVIEYHFCDSPADRDVFFTSPLEVSLPPA